MFALDYHFDDADDRPFKEAFKCWSVLMLPGADRLDVENGGKIIMPPSALQKLTTMNVEFPMLFKLTNKRSKRTTHCGVLEFIAGEGKIYIPQWMMQNLMITDDSKVIVENVSLPLANFSRFQPQSVDFLEISDPKAVLENCLRHFACLTVGDVIGIQYNGKLYELYVLETKPGNAVKIIECDMSVDFAAPIGYVEPTPVKKETPEEIMIDPATLMPEPTGFVAFKGSGSRLDGKNKGDEPIEVKPVYQRGIPDYDYNVGALQFIRNIQPTSTEQEKENKEFKAFSGFGSNLKTKKK